MRITMLRTEKGSPDGIRVEKYEAGKTYELPEELANVFIGIRSAEVAARARKGMGGAPRNKVAEPEQIPAPEAVDVPDLKLDDVAPEKPKKEKKRKALRKY